MFNELKLYPEDPVLGLSQKFKMDPHPDKINLGVGIYLNSEGKSTPFKAILEAEKNLPSHHDYLPIEGDREFLAAFDAVQGFNQDLIQCQVPGGTGGLYLGGKLLKEAGYQKIALSDPTWPNHSMIFERTPFEISSYPYYDPEGKKIKIDEFLSFLKKSPAQIILLQLTCHNPTGIDPTLNEWRMIFEAMAENNHIPFFDNAYQGFSAPFHEALEPLKIWLKKDLPFLMATSFSKNFGLYNDRAGILTVKTKSEDKDRVLSVLKRWIRVTYSNPPARGSDLIKRVWSNQSLFEMWRQELSERRERINQIRRALAEKLNMPFIENQKGLFSILGLTLDKVQALQKGYGIIMMDSSRINITGLNDLNLQKAIEAIQSVYD